MQSKKLYAALTIFIFTSLIAFSQNSLCEQNSSTKKKEAPEKAPAVTSNTSIDITPDTDLKAGDFKKQKRHEREFKDTLITGITFPEGDAAAKSEPSSSSASQQRNNAQKLEIKKSE